MSCYPEPMRSKVRSRFDDWDRDISHAVDCLDLRLELATDEDLDDHDRRDGPVDSGAEGRPPTRASDEVVAVLPEVR